MNKHDLVNLCKGICLDETKIDEICRVYNRELPDLLKEIISFTDDSIFFDDGYRLMSFAEIKSASDEYEVDFVGAGLIPFIDCYDNDFIVYNFNTATWAKYNIGDRVLFKARSELEDLLK